MLLFGDDTHEASNTTSEITAPKYDAPIDVEVGEAKEGEPVTITVTVPDDATGNVTVSVGGKDYPALLVMLLLVLVVKTILL